MRRHGMGRLEGKAISKHLEYIPAPSTLDGSCDLQWIESNDRAVAFLQTSNLHPHNDRHRLRGHKSEFRDGELSLPTVEAMSYSAHHERPLIELENCPQWQLRRFHHGHRDHELFPLWKSWFAPLDESSLPFPVWSRTAGSDQISVPVGFQCK
jgi:hypothetical protein